MPQSPDRGYSTEHLAPWGSTVRPIRNNVSSALVKEAATARP